MEIEATFQHTQIQKHPPTPTLIRKIYALVDQLETNHPGRHFTPDGHLVGSLGEAYAEEVYGLTLLSSSAKTHDAKKGKL